MDSIFQTFSNHLSEKVTTGVYARYTKVGVSAKMERIGGEDFTMCPRNRINVASQLCKATRCRPPSRVGPLPTMSFIRPVLSGLPSWELLGPPSESKAMTLHLKSARTSGRFKRPATNRGRRRNKKKLAKHVPKDGAVPPSDDEPFHSPCG
jgi:hypothetical protein